MRGPGKTKVKKIRVLNELFIVIIIYTRDADQQLCCPAVHPLKTWKQRRKQYAPLTEDKND